MMMPQEAASTVAATIGWIRPVNTPSKGNHMTIWLA